MIYFVNSGPRSKDEDQRQVHKLIAIIAERARQDSNARIHLISSLESNSFEVAQLFERATGSEIKFNTCLNEPLDVKAAADRMIGMINDCEPNNSTIIAITNSFSARVLPPYVVTWAFKKRCKQVELSYGQAVAIDFKNQTVEII